MRWAPGPAESGSRTARKEGELKKERPMLWMRAAAMVTKGGGALGGGSKTWLNMVKCVYVLQSSLDISNCDIRELAIQAIQICWTRTHKPCHIVVKCDLDVRDNGIKETVCAVPNSCLILRLHCIFSGIVKYKNKLVAAAI